MTDTFYTVTGEGRIAPEDIGGNTVLALGSFDGVHAAHRALIGETVALAEALGARAGAWCFSTLPAGHLGDEELPLLCSLSDKINTLLSLGLDFVAVGDFSALKTLSHGDFTENILKGKLNCIGCVCGFNHHFGRGGEGDPEALIDAFGRDRVTVMPEFKLDGQTVSSSAIRELISGGDVARAAKLLKSPYRLSSIVLPGKHLGRKLGFPTANQHFSHGIIVPKYGIYATLCTTADGRKHIGVSNVGIRPTITDGSDTHTVNCETFIHDFNQSIYGEILTVEFYAYLRAEQKFDSVDSLKAQIGRDLERAIEFFDGAGAID